MPDPHPRPVNAIAAARVVPVGLRLTLAGGGIGLVVLLGWGMAAAEGEGRPGVAIAVLVATAALALIATAALSASLYWIVERQRLTLIRRWWPMETIVVLRPDDVTAVEVVAGADRETHHLVLSLRQAHEDVAGPFGPRWLNALAGLATEGRAAPRRDRLRSPDFASEAAARTARRLFLGDL